MPAKWQKCCCQSVKLNTSSNCTKWCRQHWRKPSSPPDSFSCCFRFYPSQMECMNCFASVYIDDFPCGYFFSPSPLRHLLTTLPLKASSQSVIERWVQQLIARDVVWWGELEHPCHFLLWQADALCTGGTIPSISSIGQCSLGFGNWLHYHSGRRKKITLKKKCNRTHSVLLLSPFSISAYGKAHLSYWHSSNDTLFIDWLMTAVTRRPTSLPIQGNADTHILPYDYA